MSFMIHIQKQSSLLFLCATLAFLPACWGDSNNAHNSSSDAKDNSTQVLFSIDGNPVLTVDEYNEQLELAIESAPQLQVVLQMQPDAEYQYLFKTMKMAKLMKHWAQNTGIDQQADFKKEQQRLHELVDLQLFMKAYDDAHPVKVSDSELKEFYNSQKETLPGLMISQGGVKVEAVKCESEKEADAFLKALQNNHLNMKKTAEAKDQEVSEFVINESSFHSKPLKDFVADVKKYPTTKIVHADDVWWVAKAVEKTDAQYQDFEQIKEGLARLVEQRKKEEQIEKAIDELSAQFNAQENKEFFENKIKDRQGMMQAFQSQFAMTEDDVTAAADDKEDLDVSDMPKSVVI
ncbi:peptidyl-prolyl cis-trans isomerase [bacterium]|nr:peptidyl-prolyl cis-trans isomerase [bacterium]NBX78686.1 peptidyl-prolyl cis-trans isomerase [bacterium]